MNYFLTLDLTSDLLKSDKRAGRKVSEPWAAEVAPVEGTQARRQLYTGRQEAHRSGRIDHLGELLTKYKRNKRPYKLIINNKFDEMNPLTGYHEEHGSDPEQVVKRKEGENDQKYHERLLAAFVNTEHGHGDEGYQPEHFASGEQRDPVATPSRAADSEFEDEQHEEQIKTLEHILRGNVPHPKDPEKLLGYLPHEQNLRPYLRQYAKQFGLTPHVVTPKGPQKFTKIKPTAAELEEDPSLADEPEEADEAPAGTEKAGKIHPALTPILHLIQTGRWPYKKLNDAGKPVNDFTSKRTEWASGQLLREMATTLGAAGSDVYKKVSETLGNPGLEKLFGDAASGVAFAQSGPNREFYTGPFGYNKLMEDYAANPKKVAANTTLPDLIMEGYPQMLAEAEDFDPKGKDANSFLRSKFRTNFALNHFRKLLNSIGGGKETLVQSREGDDEGAEMDPELEQEAFNVAGDEEDAGAGAAPKLRSPSTARGEALYDAAKGHHLLKQQLGLNIEDPDSVKQYLFYLGRQGILEPYALRDPKKPITPQTRQARPAQGGVLSLNIGDTSPHGQYRRFYTPEELYRHDAAMKAEMKRLKSGLAASEGDALAEQVKVQLDEEGNPKLSKQQQKTLEASGDDPYGGLASGQAIKPIHSSPEAQGRLFAQMVHRGVARDPVEVERGLATTPEQTAPGATQPEYQDLHRRVMTAGHKLRKIAEEHRQLNRQLAASEGRGKKQAVEASPPARTIHVKDANGKIINIDPTSRWKKATSTEVRAKQLRDAHAAESAKAEGWLKDRPWETLTPTEIKLLDARVPDTTEQLGDLYTNGTQHIPASEFDKIKKFKERYEAHRTDAEAAARAAGKSKIREQDIFDKARAAHEADHGAPPAPPTPAPFDKAATEKRVAALKQQMEPLQKEYDDALSAFREAAQRRVVEPARTLQTAAGTGVDENMRGITAHPFAEIDPEDAAANWKKVPDSLLRMRALDLIEDKDKYATAVKAAYRGLHAKLKGEHSRKLAHYTLPLARRVYSGRDDETTKTPYEKMLAEGADTSEDEKIQKQFAEAKEHHISALEGVLSHYRPDRHKPERGPKESAGRMVDMAEGSLDAATEAAAQAHMDRVYGSYSEPEAGGGWAEGMSWGQGAAPSREHPLHDEAHKLVRDNVKRFTGLSGEEMLLGHTFGVNKLKEEVKGQRERMATMRDRELHRVVSELMNKHYLPYAAHRMHPTDPAARAAFIERHRMLSPSEFAEKQVNNEIAAAKAEGRELSHDEAMRVRKLASEGNWRGVEASEYADRAESRVKQLEKRAKLFDDYEERFGNLTGEEYNQLSSEDKEQADYYLANRKHHNEAAGQAQAIKDFLNMQRRASEGGIALTRDLLKPVPAGQEEHPFSPMAHTTPTHGGAFDPATQDFETFHGHAHVHGQHPVHGKTITQAKDFTVPMSPASFWTTHLGKVAAHRDAIKDKAERLGSTSDTLGMTPMTPEELANPSKIANPNPLKLQLAARYKAFADMHDKHYQQAQRSMHATAHAKIIEDAHAKGRATPMQLHQANVTAHNETFPAIANASASFDQHVKEHERNDNDTHKNAMLRIAHQKQMMEHLQDIGAVPAPTPEEKAQTPVAREEAKFREKQQRQKEYAEKKAATAAAPPRTLSPETLAHINKVISDAQAAKAAREAAKTTPAPTPAPKAEAPAAPQPKPTTPAPQPSPSAPTQPPAAAPAPSKGPSIAEIVAEAQKAKAAREAARTAPPAAPAPTPAPSAGVESAGPGAGAHQAFMSRFKK